MAKSKAISDLKIRTFHIDTTGKNYLIINQNDKLIMLYLKLGDLRKRFIGTVTKSTRTMEIRRERIKHLFRKLNAYGFNDYILRNQDSFDWIRLSDDSKSHWKIPVSYILEKGTYLNFREQSFELQRFVSLEDLEQFRVKTEENRRF